MHNFATQHNSHKETKEKLNQYEYKRRLKKYKGRTKRQRGRGTKQARGKTKQANAGSD